MRLWVLSTLVNSPTDALVLTAAARRGHQVQLVRPHQLPAETPDAVLARTGASAPAEALLVVARFETTGVPCVNSSGALALARDKWRTHEALTAEALPVPRTVIATGERCATPGPPPWYVKPPVGSRGTGVVRLETETDLRLLLRRSPGTWLVQEEVPSVRPGDLRVLVLDGRAVAAMRRVPAPGEHRANLHRGGRAEAAQVEGPAAELAIRAAAILGLAYAGVDLIEGPHGLRILEVNGASGLAGLEETSGLDLAGALVATLEARVNPA